MPNTTTLDSIGRTRSSSNLGLIWTTPEIQLLHRCQSDRSRRQAISLYLDEAYCLGYPLRTPQAIESRLDKHFRDNKVKFNWTPDEENHLIETFQEYPFEIAFERYNHWAQTRKYPIRARDPIYGRLGKLGVSVVDPVTIASQGSIARSLGICSQTISKYVRESGIKTEQVGQKIVCDVEQFYRWFVSSNAWIVCIKGCAQSSLKPPLDNWAVLLQIPIERLEKQWSDSVRSFIRVRSPMSSEWLTCANFARKNYITANAIRSAIRQGRSNVGSIVFEVAK